MGAPSVFILFGELFVSQSAPCRVGASHHADCFFKPSAKDGKCHTALQSCHLVMLTYKMCLYCDCSAASRAVFVLALVDYYTSANVSGKGHTSVVFLHGIMRS